MLHPSCLGEQHLLWSSPLPSLRGFLTFSFLSRSFVETFELAGIADLLVISSWRLLPSRKALGEHENCHSLLNFLHSKQRPQKPLVAASQPASHWKAVMLPGFELFFFPDDNLINV